MSLLFISVIVSVPFLISFTSLRSNLSRLSYLLRLSDKVRKYVRRRYKAYRFLFFGAEMIGEAYKEANGQAFEIPGPDHGHVFVSSKEHIAEMKKAGKNELSMFGATKQMFQPAHTMLGHNWLDERGAEGIGYVRAVGNLFPRQLRNMMPELDKAVQDSFNKYTKPYMKEKGEMSVPAYQVNKKILTKLNALCFFGEELAQDELFLERIFKYNELVITAAEVLRVLPEFLKGIVGPIVGRHSDVQNVVFNMINGCVTRRMEKKRLSEAGEIDWQAPSDMIQWLIDTAPPELNWGPSRVTYEIIAIWFGSVHALSGTVTYALIDLCQNNQYVEPLRNEVESSEFDAFMESTKGLPLLDSFMKESTRLNPIESMSGRRQALRDFTFNDGTLVKKSDWICIPVKAMMNDDSYFPQATRFDGFRFAPRNKIPGNIEYVSQPEGPSKYADISANYHAWGIGGIVCPGRFYSAVATKIILAHILKNFDATLESSDPKVSQIWRSYVLPKEDVHVKFTPRV